MMEIVFDVGPPIPPTRALAGEAANTPFYP
jgi:hypothetical protein